MSPNQESSLATPERPLNVGILALQGAFRDHLEAFASLPGVNSYIVNKPEDLDELDGLVIPGGESTTMSLIAQRLNMLLPLREYVANGKPVWGTCAGMILLSKKASHVKIGGQEFLEGMDITTERNFFGRQFDSFEQDIKVDVLGEDPFKCIFIRAPAITAVDPSVKILATIETPTREYPSVIVAAQQKHMLVTAFHPELTQDNRWHAFFVDMIENIQAHQSSTA